MTLSTSVSSNDSIPRPREDALYQVRLLSALRSGDPAQIHPFLTEIGKDARISTDSDSNRGPAALHLAIRCATCDTISLLLSHRAISPNAVHPPGSGTTPLHLAASLSRADVVTLLLEQEHIDDTLRDSQGKTCLEVAKGKDTVHAIKDSRAFLTVSYRSLLRTYIFSSPSERLPPPLVTLLSSPRSRLIDLSYLDESSGTSILHEAARRKDIKAIDLAIRAGADVFVRDRKGRTVYESVGKDDRVKAFLRQFTNQDISLIEPPSTESPEHRGYLNKYTNVARGYNTRWFVLRNGVLSYYRHQDDEGVASRGSISMGTAVLKSTPGSGGLRFEVQSTPTRGHAQKWYMKANHPVEASRWLQVLNKSIEWCRREAENQRKSGESEATSLRPASTRGAPSLTHTRSRRSEIDRLTSAASSNADDEPSDGALHGKDGSAEGHPDDSNVEGGKETEDSSLEESEHFPPYSHTFELQGNTTLTQLELTAQMVSDLLQATNVAASADLRKALQDSIGMTHGMLTEYVQMVKEREEWWKDELEREHQRQNVWEESLRVVVREGEELEKQLRNTSRRRSRIVDSGFVTVSEMGTIRSRPSHLALQSPPLDETPKVVESPAPLLDGVSSEVQLLPLSVVPATAAAVVVSPMTQVVLAPAPQLPSPSRQITVTSPPLMAPSISRPFSLIMGPSPAKQQGEIESLVDTDEEDEFFDAIESNTLPNLVVNESLTHRSLTEIQRIIHKEQYVGYADLRTKLGITSDDRPPMSLWAVLKNSIGKDLTKISFPVFFNEPTSMLQRMAEDMEFSECLDAASAELDPHRRIAFVAAFAMSNYSSTIGRIAKPFNPMLSETFEYVRIDKEYRYMSEQVSHHPPISACWAESPKWRYYGEVDAQNKFMGKSFEIRPTGVAHVDLLLPEEKAPGYPKAKGSFLAGKVVEHYSWKKVTTNISGFILGSPTIDHYGDMIVTNHRTGDQCVLTFKPRGWRGRDAFEISGYVMDLHGTVTYEIAGRWNSQLVARQVGTGVGHLHPDVSINSPSSLSPSLSTTPEYILLWRNSLKPSAPFNLTPFAITLNDCPDDTLKPYLCPTDCRLRPDQRAFEMGRYEHANDLKNKQEEYQRGTRKAREEGRKKAHRPRWFEAETEPDTGERVWAPVRVGGGVEGGGERLEYWVVREEVWRGRKEGREVGWKGVERIFIEDDP